ncbi:Diacylglycerol kinase [Candidatus Competibacter denitrificans Run_A_D11]|uniref:Diacylglycerol kinase n=1 Tax=Candidatus Competibacter denitrificans Run_A_D11 TaxID=1400863 RepID=W6M0E9_9GAMM|nr:diacylglycerol kinase [Candidatus Competibacter denitrificans]CDI00882.1 Diacylglycerol kinase [Candidatus Competibacter denitrificans Run_A_D11]HAS87306.1 diacylglycerol kinase [Candidatus Competibacteraceae bacterium]HRC69338.1 diacylglycerol kinase [Candidatus Competibacter denitrificans]
MAFQNHTGWRRLINATGYSWAGLKAAWHNEEAFRQESLLCAVFAPLALWLGNTPVERALLIGSLLLVVIVELLNTGIEAAIDRIGPERHELSGRAKDIGSAAVFMALLNAAIVWLLIVFD